MSDLQCLFLFTSALAALLATGSRRSTSPSLLAYFGIVVVTVGAVWAGTWQWTGTIYLREEAWRAVCAAAFAIEGLWQLGLQRRARREAIFRMACLGLAAGTGGALLTYLPHGEFGWGLRTVVGLHLAVAAILSEVGRHERLEGWRQTAAHWLFIVAVADALNVAAVEGALRQAADWLNVTLWCGMCFMVCISAFESGSGAKPRPTPPPSLG